MGEMPQLVTKFGVDLSALDGQLQNGLFKQEAFVKKQENVHKESLGRVERMYARVKVQNAIQIANVSGNKEQLQDLQDALELQRQIGLAKRSGMNNDHATAAAQEQMAAIKAARAEAEASAAAVAEANRAAAAEQIGLQERLAVARAAGEKREIAALEEELALVQAIARYRAAGFGEEEAASMAGAHMGNLGQARKQAKRGNVGEAVENTLEHSRIGVLEEGAARIPIFGSALEALGPAGLVAAGGVLAAAEAMDHAKEAAEYAEELSNAAAKLGVTTKALQEYQYAALASGVGSDAMREALQKGNEVLGAFQSGVGAAKIKPVFQALGITQEEAQKAGSIADLLPEIADKIKGLGSTAEQAKVAEKLGLSDILPVLQKGKEGMAELTAEAEQSGVVLDANLIEKGKKAAEELKKASDVVDMQMKRAFIELAPAIEACLGLAMQLARTFADTVENFGAISSFSRTHAQDSADNSQRTMDYWAEHSGGALTGKGKVVNGELVGGTAFARWKYDQARDVNRQAVSTVNMRELEDRADAAKLQGGSAKTLVEPKEKKPKKPSADKTENFQNTADKMLDEAKLGELKQRDELGSTLEQRIAVMHQEVDAETKAKDDEISQKRTAIEASKGLSAATRKALNAELDQVAAIDAAAAEEKKATEERKLRRTEEDRQRELASAITSAMAAHLDAEAQTAKTVADRRQLELKALAIRQQQQDEDDATWAKRLRQDHPGAETEKTISDTMEAHADAQSDARSAVIVQTNSPGRAFDRDLNMQKDDLSDQLETVEVSGVEKLGDALQDVITQTKSVKDAFRDMAMSIVADLLKIEIKRAIETPLANMMFGPPKGSVQVGPISSTADAASGALGGGGGSGVPAIPGFGPSLLGLGSSGSLDTALTNTGMDPTGNADANVVGKGISFMGSFAKLFGIPGFKDGTDDAPGGVTEVGENGPELLKVPGGSQVMTNTELRALPSGGPASSAQSVNLTHRVTIDLTGANGDQAIAAAAHSAATAAYAQAVATSRKDMQRSNRSRQQSLLNH